jgi:hypothetical protein
MKSKFAFGLLAMMLVLALAPSSFAQVNLQAFGNPSAMEVDTNRTAQTADPQSAGAGLLVSGSAIATAPVTRTSLFIDYPAVVTSSPTIPSADAVRIEGATGLFSGVTVSSINYSTGVVEISLPGCLPDGVTGCVTPTVGDPNGTGSFRLVGIRNDVNGLTAPLNATLSLNSSSNNYILSTSSVPVISALGPGIGSLAIGARSGSTNNGTATILTTGSAIDAQASLLITEGFAAAWRTAVQSSTQSAGPTSNGTNVRLTFAGVPSGVTVTLSVASWSSSLGTPTLSTTSITSSSLTSTLSFPATSMTAVESVQINMSFSNTTTPPAVGAVTVTATMAPVAAALSGSLTPFESDGYPKFAAAEVGPVTVASIVTASTTLLVPFAVRDGGFDTGISLANTTADPFGGSTGGGGTPSAGTIRMDFFPRLATGGAGPSFSLTTSATARPGIGLSADGTLAAGATWTVLLSELLTAAGQTGSFTGYVFLQTNFLLAHGAPFVSDFRNFTSFSPMLVLPPVSAGAPRGSAAALVQAVERLTF